jgi:hypothetical protein
MSVKMEIEKVVKASLPKGKPIKIEWEKTMLGRRWEVLRVITPAWKSIPGSERNCRLQKILDKQLTEKQRDHIFRVSVLTPAEAKRRQELVAA